MALGGEYFSDFLLMSLYASGTRMVDGLGEEDRKAQGDLFTRLARDLLAKEMEKPSKITTIREPCSSYSRAVSAQQAEGLLVLSGRECAIGNVSQGWLHAGMVRPTISNASH